MTEWWKIKGEKVDDAELDKRIQTGQVYFFFGYVVVGRIYSYLCQTEFLMNFFNSCEVYGFYDICRIIIPIPLVSFLGASVCLDDYTIKKTFYSIFVPSFVVVVGFLVSYYYGYLCLFGKAGRPAEDIICFVLGFLTFLLGVYLCWRNKISLRKVFSEK